MSFIKRSTAKLQTAKKCCNSTRLNGTSFAIQCLRYRPFYLKKMQPFYIVKRGIVLASLFAFRLQGDFMKFLKLSLAIIFFFSSHSLLSAPYKKLSAKEPVSSVMTSKNFKTISKTRVQALTESRTAKSSAGNPFFMYGIFMTVAAMSACLWIVFWNKARS
jgi:hypothetical protein